MTDPIQPHDAEGMLLPCPFCGDQDEFGPCLSPIQKYAKPGDPETGQLADLSAGLVDAGWLVECCNCSACGASAPTRSEASEAWNTRALPIATRPAVEDGRKVERVASIIDRIDVQAKCLEGYAEQSGFSGKAPASVFHWQATHFRDLAAELRAALALPDTTKDTPA